LTQASQQAISQTKHPPYSFLLQERFEQRRTLIQGLDGGAFQQHDRLRWLGWDTHSQNFEALKTELQGWSDAALSSRGDLKIQQR
jgi:hypothetical protein